MSSLIGATIGKCAKNITFTIKEVALKIDLHPAVDIASLIQGVCLRLTNGKTVIFESGIGTTLSNAKLPISEVILKTKADLKLTIPLPANLSTKITKTTKIFLYLTDSGRECAGAFTLQME
ncbi:MAG TPA: hypothetical protein DEA43_01455 [Candidatus Moranbacteria bacterium]|nr:hypothetical protein [Candidatus Moranbacteria bacterium]HBT45535.1 hypothetical protein [Candidatus Moranbacteria bacterium]